MSRVTLIHARLTMLSILMILAGIILSGCENMPSTHRDTNAPTQAEDNSQDSLLDYATETETQDQSTSNTTIEEQAEKKQALDNKVLLELVKEAKQSPSPKREALLIKATHTALGMNNTALAKKIYVLINQQELTPQADIDYYYELIGLELAVAQRDQDQATDKYQALENISNSRKIPLNQSHYLKDSLIRASALALHGDHLAAARLLVFRFEGINQSELQITQDLHNTIWLYISIHRQSKLTENKLHNNKKKPLSVQIATAPSEEWQAWLELSDIFEQSDRNRLSYMQGQIKTWQNNWNSTLVSQLPPEDVSELLIADFQQATHVAVLLPTSGPLQHAAKAIIDGIMAAYYREQNTGQQNLKLTFFNTASDDNTEVDIIQLYEKAKSQGAEFIIGPLQKEKVTALKQHLATLVTGDKKIPVLALNYTKEDEQSISSRAFFEFGLSAEGEAEAVASYAFLQGYERALILRPDTPWGERISAAFTQRFTSMSGKVLDEAAFTQPRQFSNEVQKLLGIEISQTRHKQIEQELGKKLDYTPRRRQDVDFIFLLASPNEARQLKPTINYHYGQNIPVFSTSHLYTGSSNPTYDKDLNNIIFADIPWILNQDSDLKKSFDENIPHAQNQLKRLHALGIDAFQLMREFPVLKHVSSSSLPGTTGLLTIEADGKVKRELSWAVFKNGEAMPIKEKIRSK